MIEIYVASYKGISPPVELKGLFGPEGGTIGRGNDNQLVLPDPARHVSRLQARITCDGERFLVANVANANPLFINDEEITSGSELPINPGDELRIGLYVLGVRIATPSSQNSDASVAKDPSPHPPVAGNVGKRPAAIGGALDPLAGLGGPSNALNPFADLLGPGVAMPPSPEPVTSASSSGRNRSILLMAIASASICCSR
jgi:predicted component of type VI protein secretion system